MDETDRQAMIAVGIASTITVIVVGWRVRPRPPARAVRHGGSRVRWPIIGIIGLVAIVAPLIAVALLVVGWFGRRWIAVRQRANAVRQVAANYPDALDLLVLSIRAGYMPADAVVEVTPFLSPALRPAFGAVATAMNSGERFADALSVLHTHLGPIAQPLVDSLSAADRYGLPLAPVLERLAFEARQQRRRDADANARELPVRLAMPMVLCTLPSFVLLAIVPLLLGALSSLHT
jgi:tight adherence protein C